MFYSKVLLLLAGSSLVLAQQREAGFNLEAYAGKWYQLFATKGMRFQSDDQTDVSAQYGLLPNGSVSVYNQGWNPGRGWSTIRGYAYPVSEDDLSDLIVQFPYSPPGSYKVLYTDYRSFAIVWSAPEQYCWILGRQTTIEDEEAEQLFALVKAGTGLDREDFVETRHGVAPVQVGFFQYWQRPQQQGSILHQIFRSPNMGLIQEQFAESEEIEVEGDEMELPAFWDIDYEGPWAIPDYDEEEQEDDEPEMTMPPVDWFFFQPQQQQRRSWVWPQQQQQQQQQWMPPARHSQQAWPFNKQPHHGQQWNMFPQFGRRMMFPSHHGWM